MSGLGPLAALETCLSFVAQETRNGLALDTDRCSSRLPSSSVESICHMAYPWDPENEQMLRELPLSTMAF